MAEPGPPLVRSPASPAPRLRRDRGSAVWRITELGSVAGSDSTKRRERIVAETKALNPWTWQDQYGFSQAIEVRGGERVLYCAGQTSVDANGGAIHGRDLPKQINQAFDNLETVLKEAGLTLTNVVRLNYYTTD